MPVENIGNAVRKRIVVGDVDRERFSAAPPAAIAATVSPAASTLRSTTTTCAPSRAMMAAPARPIPEPAPVTIAIRLFRIIVSLPGFAFLFAHEHAGGQDK